MIRHHIKYALRHPIQYIHGTIGLYLYERPRGRKGLHRKGMRRTETDMNYISPT